MRGATLREPFCFADLPWPCVVLPVGPPACGKSTLGRRLVAEAARDGRELGVVSRDEIRAATFGAVNDFSDEEAVTGIAQRQIAQLLDRGGGVYLDETNLAPPLRRAMVAHLRDAHPGVALAGVLCAEDLGVEALMGRNRERSAAEAGRPLVDRGDIVRMAATWARTGAANLYLEGFDVIAVFDDEGLWRPPGPAAPGAHRGRSGT